MTDDDFSRKNTFYAKRSKTLTEICIPLLRDAFSAAPASGLSTAIDLVIRHLHFYYNTLENYADSDNIHNILFPSGRNSLEASILFRGNIHPYLLTNLIRSCNSRVNKESHGNRLDLAAWEDPTLKLVVDIDWIESAIELTVPALLERMSQAQKRFLARASNNWVSSYHSQGERQMKTVMALAEAARESTNEIVSLFRDANRSRKIVIMDIVKATTRQQAALFLEGLCEFLAGFKDQVLLRDVESIPMAHIQARDQEFRNSPFAIQHHAPEPARSLSQRVTPHYWALPPPVAQHYWAPPQPVAQHFWALSQPIPPNYWTPPQPVPAYNNTLMYTIFVGNLAPDVTNHVLRETFVHYHLVVDANVMTFQDLERCRGYGFVSSSDENEKNHAKENMDSVICSDRPMRTGEAKFKSKELTS